MFVIFFSQTYDMTQVLVLQVAQVIFHSLSQGISVEK